MRNPHSLSDPCSCGHQRKKQAQMYIKLGGARKKLGERKGGDGTKGGKESQGGREKSNFLKT